MAIDDGPVKICQQEIVKLDLKINALIQDIHGCEGPIDVLYDINKDARQRIQDTKSKIEDLERLAREQDKETDQIVLLKHVDSHRKQLSSTQTVLRQAIISCQMGIEQQEKSTLLHGGTDTRQRSTLAIEIPTLPGLLCILDNYTLRLQVRVMSNKANLANTSSNITETLMSISRNMSSQVKRADQTMNVLVTSSKQVTSVHSEFENMSGHIQHSRKLLTKYGRRECTDKLIILLALVFFFATVLYILKKRLFDAVDASTGHSPT